MSRHVHIAAILLCLSLIAAAPATKQAASQPAVEKFVVKSKIEVKEASSWKPAIIQQRDGELYLIKYDGWDAQFHWEWVTTERMRAVGSDKEGPDFPMSDPIGNRTLILAKNEAKKKLAAAKLAAKNAPVSPETPTDAKTSTSIGPNSAQGVASGAGTAKASASAGPGGKQATATVTPPAAEPAIVVPPEPEHPAPAAAPLKDVTPQRNAVAAWRYVPPVAPPAVTKDASVTLTGGSGDFFERFGQVLLNRPQFNIAAASYSIYDGGVTKLRIGRVSLEGAKLPAIATEMKSLALSPDGKKLIVISGSSRTSIATVLDLDKNPPARAARFTPFDDAAPWNDISSAMYIDDAHVLFQNRQGTICVWDLAASAGLYKLSGSWAMALSNDGKTLAVGVTGKTYLFDSITGATLGELPASDRWMAFNGSGTRFACVTSNRIIVWDLTNGSELQDVAVPPVRNISTPVWVSDEFLAVGEHVFSVKKGAFVHRYAMPSGMEPVEMSPTDRFCFLTPAPDGKNKVLNFVAPPVQPLVDAEAKLKDADIFAASPGSSISLEISLDASEASRTAAVAALQEKLAANQLKVADGQPVKLIASTEAGKTQEQTFENFETRERQKISVTPTVMKLRFMVNDKLVWTSTGSSGISMMYKAGKSIEEQIEADRQASIANFFKNAWLPSKVPAPIDPAKLPNSQLK